MFFAEVEVQLVEFFRRHVARFAAFQNGCGELACFLARAEGIHAQGGNRAARYRVGIGGDQGDFQFHRGFIHGFVRGNDVVVERGENHVGFAAQAACGGQYVGRTLCWRGDYLDVLFGGFGFQAFEHGGGIDFGGAVDVADGFQVGHQFFHQVDLRADGQFVGYAGDVGVRGFERGHEFGADGVGYGGVDEGDVFSGSGDCLCAGGGDGDDGVGVGTGEFFRDLGGVGGAALRALEVYGEVFAFFKAFGFQAVQNACADGVERRVVGDGGDGDFFLFRRRSSRGGGGLAVVGLFVRRCAGGEDGGGNDAEYGAGVCGARGHGQFSFAERVKL